MTTRTPTVPQATVRKLLAEAKAYESEAKYNTLQGERLVRVRLEEDASLDRQRILDFVGEVDSTSVSHAMRKLTEWRQKGKAPISIRFNTGGGEIIPGMALYDYICLLSNEGIEVTTIALGTAASMGCTLLQAGTKRYVAPQSWLMIHELAAGAEGGLSEIRDSTKFYERMDKQILTILSQRSGLSVSSIRRHTARGKEWWLDAPEAVKYGFADGILMTPDVGA